MWRIAIAATAATMVCACVATGHGNGNGHAIGARAAAGGAKQYCLESRLASVGTRHNCTWSQDKQAACEGELPFVALDASRYTSPRTSAQCGNGKWVVEMSPLG